MLSEFGVGAFIGLAILAYMLGASRVVALVVSPVVGAFKPTVQKTESLMPFNIPTVRRIDADEYKVQIARKVRDADDVTEFVQFLQAQGVVAVGTGLELPVETVPFRFKADKQHPTDWDGTEKFIVGTQGGDYPDGITVKQMKRKLGQAARVLGFDMKWKEPQGWLIGLAASSEVKKSTEAQATTEATTSAPAAQAATTGRQAAPAAPAAPATTTGRQAAPAAQAATTGRIQAPTGRQATTPPTPPTPPPTSVEPTQGTSTRGRGRNR